MLSKKQVVVGAFGFIGSNLVEKISGNHQVLCIDDLSNSVTADLINSLTCKSDVTAFFRDINDSEFWNEIQEWCGEDEVDLWHLAANSDIRASGTSPRIDFERTFQTTVSVVELCNRLNVKKLMFASTSAVYGEPKNPEITLLEKSECNPISYYGAAKLASEIFLNVLGGFSEVQQYHFRFANIVGSPATHGLILDILNHIKLGKNPIPILGDGNQQKSYLEVNALISDMLSIVETSNVGTYNLGPGDSGISVKEIVTLIRDHAAPNSEISFESSAAGWLGDVPRILLNTSKAEEVINDPRSSSFSAIHTALHAVCLQLNLEFQCNNL